MYKTVVFPAVKALSRNAAHDAERAHNLAIATFRAVQCTPFTIDLISHAYGTVEGSHPVTIAGIYFPNRIGMAAGFDKNGQVVPMLAALGFGFVEVGTVTPRFQAGNARVRMRRIAFEGIWNCMGFNNDGAEAIANRLAALDASDRIRIPIGVSLGKQKETPIEEAVADYLAVKHAFDAKFRADYYVINVSSPNTKDLRLLQKRNHIENLVQQLVEDERKRTPSVFSRTPFFVKLAPDLTAGETAVTIGAAENAGARGIIDGNTTTMRPKGIPPWRVFFDEAGNPRGGYSGPHLFPRTLARTKFIRSLTELPLIAVGGISNSDHAAQLYDAGADLLQVLTGFIYQGPALIQELRRVGHGTNH